MGFDDSDLWRFTRRNFLVLFASLVAAMSLGGIPGAGTGNTAEINFPEGKCEGKKAAEKRVLVAYASKYGSTGGVADAIGKELCSKEMAADMALIRNAGNLSSYRGVIIGSAIYMGNWMSEAVDFVKENKDALSKVPIAYFLVGMSLSRPTEENRA